MNSPQNMDSRSEQSDADRYAAAKAGRRSRRSDSKPNKPARHLLRGRAVGAVCTSLLLMAFTAVAADSASADMAKVINAARAARGLPTIAAAAGDSPLSIAASAQASSGPDVLSDVYARHGGTQHVGSLILRTDRFADDFASAPEDLALVLDPRATAFASASGVTNDSEHLPQHVLAVQADPSVAWTTPLWITAPSVTGPNAIVLLPELTRGVARLQVMYGSTWTTLNRYDANWENAGAIGFGVGNVVSVRLSSYSINLVRLGYNRHYRVMPAHGDPLPFATGPMPTDYQKRTWQFDKGMTPADRRLFLSAIVRARSSARRLAAIIDGGIQVSPSRNRRIWFDPNWPVSSCSGDQEDKKYGCWNVQLRATPNIGYPRAELRGPYRKRLTAVYHGLGFVVGATYLDDHGRAAFARSFRRSPKWKKCFHQANVDPRVTGCAESSTIFADQFSYWAGGGALGHDPPLVSRRAFGVLLQRYLNVYP